MHEPTHEGANPTDDFAPAGPWEGFYLQSGHRHEQRLHLSFTQGRIRGTGIDDLGRFSITGRYDLDSREALWTKHYLGGHDVHYRGFREIRGIWGTWDIDDVYRGGFHIWPLGEGEGLHESAEEREPVPVARVSF